jgi:hypothetical protein
MVCRLDQQSTQFAERLIFNYYSLLSSPGKIGVFVINSAKMHPTLHISTALEYLFQFNKTSGALYHLVAIYSVKTFFLSDKSSMIGRDKPKSQIFSSHVELTKIFLGFFINSYIKFFTKSLCIMFAEWIYFRPRKI